MSFTQNTTYPVDVETAFQYFASGENTQARYEALGDKNVEVIESGVTADGGARIVTKRVVEMDLPKFAKKAFNPTNTLTQTDVWSPADANGVRTGTWKAEIAGAPVQSGGTMKLEPEANGCRYTVFGEINVKVPIVGGKIAQFAEGSANDILTSEIEHTRGALTS